MLWPSWFQGQGVVAWFGRIHIGLVETAQFTLLQTWNFWSGRYNSANSETAVVIPGKREMHRPVLEYFLILGSLGESDIHYCLRNTCYRPGHDFQDRRMKSLRGSVIFREYPLARVRSGDTGQTLALFTRTFGASSYFLLLAQLSVIRGVPHVTHTVSTSHHAHFGHAQRFHSQQSETGSHVPCVWCVAPVLFHRHWWNCKRMTTGRPFPGEVTLLARGCPFWEATFLLFFPFFCFRERDCLLGSLTWSDPVWFTGCWRPPFF